MERIEASDYHDITQVSEPRIAPGGDAVVFVRRIPETGEDHEATIYRVPAEERDDRSVEAGTPEQFTVAEGVDSEPRFSPTGDRLAFVSTRGADDERPQLWMMPTDGGEARQVTNLPGGVSGIAWSPGGDRIAFAQETTPEEREEGIDLDVANGDAEEYERETPDPRVIDRLVYRSAERYFDGARSHVYVVDLSDDSVDRVTGGEYDYVAPDWGDGSTLYYAVKRGADPDDSTLHDVVAHDLDAGETETVTTTHAFLPQLAATDDGRVAFTHTPEGSTLRQTDLHVYDRGADELAVPTDGLDRTLHYDTAIEWGPDAEEVYFATPDEGADTLWRVRWDGDAPDPVVGDGTLNGFSVGEEGVAYTQSEWDHRGDVFVATPSGTDRTRLTRVNEEYLADRMVGEPEEIRFTNDGVDLQGWVLTPPGFDPEEEYPLAVEIHGGPHAMYTESGTMWHEFQTLAARGYVVFWCNPRGSAGYGEAFMAAIERDWGAVTMDDVLAGADRVTEREYVDEDSQFVTGGSFGGYMSGWIVGHTDRFEGAVAQRGVYDLVGFYGATDGAFRLVEDDFGTTPLEESEYLREHSPIGHAGNVATPTLLVHAERDFRVPINDAEVFYRLLLKNGVETRFVRYPREGHELSRSGEPDHVVDRLERIARWFDGYSDHHDVAPALERDPGDGLTTEADDGRNDPGASDDGGADPGACDDEGDRNDS